jgi:hypothetical protein
LKSVLPIGLSGLALLLAGCGSSAPTPIPTRVSNVIEATHAGVRFSAEVRIHDKRECFFTNYRILARHVKPLEQTTRSCGPSDQPAPPMLIEVARPRTVLILDRPTRGCSTVTITTGRGRPIVAKAKCSTTTPTLRVTPLPSATTLTIHGITGVARLALRKYPCSLICTRVIAAPS